MLLLSLSARVCFRCRERRICWLSMQPRASLSRHLSFGGFPFGPFGERLLSTRLRSSLVPGSGSRRPIACPLGRLQGRRISPYCIRGEVLVYAPWQYLPQAIEGYLPPSMMHRRDVVVGVDFKKSVLQCRMERTCYRLEFSCCVCTLP